MSTRAEVPEVPGLLALLGLLFFKPLTLHRMLQAWGFEGDPSLWALRKRWREPVVRQWVGRSALALLVLPFVVVGLLGVGLDILGFEWSWRAIIGMRIPIAFGVAIGVISGVAAGVALGLAGSVVGGVAIGIARGVTSHVAGGVALDEVSMAALVGGVVTGVAIGTAVGVGTSLERGAASGVAGGVAFGLAAGVVLGVTSGVTAGAAAGLAWIVGAIRAPHFFSYGIACLGLRWANPPGSTSVHGTRLLPTRWDEIIYIPLPFLRGLLIHFAERRPELGAILITEASANVGQRKIAQSALNHLQIKALTQMAQASDWTWPDSPFLPTMAAIEADSLLHPFAQAAPNLDAVTVIQRAQQRRRRLLSGARQQLSSAQTTLISRGKRRDQIWLAPLQAWLDAVDRLEAALNAETPEVPDVFQEGNRLNRSDADHRALFKGRRDLVAIIDGDLSARQRAPLLLTGQRRMGKSSLLQMLPRLLGTVETVVIVDFQQVAGEADRGHPHRILAQRLHAALPDLSSPPQAETWGSTLEWLATVDALLETRQHRVLLALDEIERLQDGIRDGWAPADFLDFLRAAGDRLLQIRMLLVSAHPLQRLGPVWCDRLISAVQRSIGPLEPDQARELLTAPIPDFPPIWPAGAVERVCRLTGHHPFLLQLVGNRVVQALNRRGEFLATTADVDRALDHAVNSAPLFSDLWKDRRADEQRLLRRLAGASEADSLEVRPLAADEQTAAAWLRREGFIIDAADGVRIATPLFATWIRVWSAPDS